MLSHVGGEGPQHGCRPSESQLYGEIVVKGGESLLRHARRDPLVEPVPGGVGECRAAPKIQRRPEQGQPNTIVRSLAGLGQQPTEPVQVYRLSWADQAVTVTVRGQLHTWQGRDRPAQT